jgi:hypothetical protein
MYLEIVFALVLALLVLTFDTGRLALSIGLFLLLALIAEAITLTFTRAGLATMAVATGFVGLLRYRQKGFDAAVRAIVALLVVIACQFVVSRPTEAVLLRVTTEGQQSWYRAAVDAPADLTVATGAIVSVPVTLTNRGRSTWDPSAAAPFLLSYHWLDAGGHRVVEFEGLRTAFPAVVAPGDTIAVQARVRAPGVPGRYRLLWDIVLERRLWFSMEPNAERVFTEATVTGPPVGPPPVSRVTAMPRATSRPGRFTLWRVGARMLTAYPLLGVGPDNFRLSYGEFADLPHFDTRVHSNNMYVEMLVGGGLLGGMAFGWLCVSVFSLIVRAVRSSPPEMMAVVAGIAAAGMAIALHGLVDSFLGFTSTYVLISITLGLAVATDHARQSRPRL